MFLSEVSGKRCCRKQRDRKPAFHYNPEGPCLQINGLLIRDTEYRSGRPLGGSTACGRKRISISENCTRRTGAAGHRNSSRIKAWGREHEAAIGWPCFRDATVERQHYGTRRTNRAISRAGMFLPLKYSYELPDHSRAVRMRLDLRISDEAAVTTNRRCGDFHEPTVRLPPTTTHPDRPSCTARSGLRSRESSAASPHCRIRRKPGDDPTVAASRPTSRPPQPALHLCTTALTAGKTTGMRLGDARHDGSGGRRHARR